MEANPFAEFRWVARPTMARGKRMPVRSGTVEENTDTLSKGLAGFFVAVTREELGVVRYYIWCTLPGRKYACWVGPFQGLSEEIVI